MFRKTYLFSDDKRILLFKGINKQLISQLVFVSFAMLQVITYTFIVYISSEQDNLSSHRSFIRWLSFIIATPVVFYSANPFLRNAWNALKIRRLSKDFPVSLAILSAYFASIYALIYEKNNDYFDSVIIFIFILLIGRVLEQKARYHSLLNKTNLHRLIPITVKKIINNQVFDIPVSDIEYDDKLIIPKGSIIPVDGVLLENPAEINEAIMTGESLLIRKQPNDKLISGSTNHSSSLTMLANRDFTRSKINQLANLQQIAEKLKPTSVYMTEKTTHWFVVCLLTVLLVASTIWWFIDGAQAFSIALSILLVSSPHAFSLATKATFAATTSQLTDLGFILRNSETLTNLSKVNQVFFDKTGTLTEGKISIDKVEIYSDYTEQQLINFASLLENISNHPIAEAFKYYLEDDHDTFNSDMSSSDIRSSNKPNFETIVLTNHQEIFGKGVIANINKKRYLLGKVNFLIEDNETIFKKDYVNKQQHEDEIKELKTAYLKHKGMAVFLSEDGKLIAKFHLKDKLKSSASKCIAELKKSIDVSLLTGDSGQSATKVNQTLKIKNVIANASPEDKLKTIQRVQQKDLSVMMVGNGFNDLDTLDTSGASGASGALNSTNISVSLASNLDLSQSKSDVVLVSEDLMAIPKAIELSKKLQTIIKQNLGWAITYNLLAIPLAALGFIPVWIAAIGMSLSSLVVVLNALRLRK